MRNRYYIDLRPEELRRANHEVTKRLFGHTVSDAALLKCAETLGRIITQEGLPLPKAVEEAVRRELPRRQRRGSCAKRAYREALRAAIWYRHDSIAPFIEGNEGVPPEKPA